MKPATPEELAKLGFKPLSPADLAKRQTEYDAQIEAIPVRIRERYEARIAAGWQPAFAAEDALHRAAQIGSNHEATIQQMTIGASALSRGWQHSEAFVGCWNAMFPDAALVSGFACPCTVDLPNGQRAAIAAEWSLFLSQRKADA